MPTWTMGKILSKPLGWRTNEIFAPLWSKAKWKGWVRHLQSWRLKNIIILILTLVNVFLLSSLFLRKTEDSASHRQTTAELTMLFSADGIALTPSAISEQMVPEGRTLTRSAELDRKLATFLLGKSAIESEKDGGIFSYESALGSALFRASGGFEATGALSGENDPETFFRRFCRSFGYEVLSLSPESGTAVQRHNGYPVVNCTVTFTIADGAVTALSGTHIPSTYTAVDSTAPLSVLTALTAFLEYRRESGAVVSAVTDTFPCYELQSTTTAPMTLVPQWCIVTSAGNYYVNCFTGTVSHG